MRPAPRGQDGRGPAGAPSLSWSACFRCHTDVIGEAALVKPRDPLPLSYGLKSVIMTGCGGSHQHHSKEAGALQEVVGTGNQLSVTTGAACPATHIVVHGPQGLFLCRIFCTVRMFRNVSVALQEGYQTGEAQPFGDSVELCLTDSPPTVQLGRPHFFFPCFLCQTMCFICTSVLLCNSTAKKPGSANMLGQKAECDTLVLLYTKGGYFTTSCLHFILKVKESDRDHAEKCLNTASGTCGRLFLDLTHPDIVAASPKSGTKVHAA
ncbi:hypothetical protein Q8A73_012105 [Channa argus]|nr:hypothetical protein Q8A73_012105 [Channa argus]